MSRRKKLPNRLRFEVLKRDGFACVYCGAAAPAVVLNVDHVVPVVSGGTDDPTNLVSSCATCNNGKGAIPLTTTAGADAKRAAMERDREMAEFIDLYNEWLAERRARLIQESDRLSEYWSAKALHGAFVLTPDAAATLRKFSDRLGEVVVMEAMDIAIDRLQMPPPDPKWKTGGTKLRAWLAVADRRFRYFCGVCHNKIKALP